MTITPEALEALLEAYRRDVYRDLPESWFRFPAIRRSPPPEVFIPFDVGPGPDPDPEKRYRVRRLPFGWGPGGASGPDPGPRG